MKSQVAIALCALTLTKSVYASPCVQPRAKISDLPVISETKTNGTSTTATNSSVVLPDGRIKQDAVATDFNVLASVFKSAVVKGDGRIATTPINT
jgi:hypothetical protein